MAAGSDSVGGDDDGPSIPGFVFDLQPLTGFVDLLTDFARDPRRFIVGAVLTTGLEVVFGVVTEFIDLVLLVFGGSRPGTFDAPGETLGIADIPVAVANDLSAVGGSFGTTILVTIQSFNSVVFEAAGALGPLSPLVITVVVVGEIVVAIVVLRRLVYVIADLLQLGGLTE